MTEYHKILTKAKQVKHNVETKYTVGIPIQWSYLFAKSILNPKKDVTGKKDIGKAPKPHGTHISRQIPQKQYTQLAKNLIAYVDRTGRVPNFLSWNGYKIRARLYHYMFARIIVYYSLHGKLPKYVTVNSKAFNKPTEPCDTVYDYFTSQFGEVNSIDEALSKIDSHGYGYYYDDVYSNKEAINRMKLYQGVNCTDSCHVFYNITLHLIKLGKYKKVECLHVLCSGGDGHVRLRIQLNTGEWIYRDPAAILDGGELAYNWCSSGELLAVNPSWFMENLSR